MGDNKKKKKRKPFRGVLGFFIKRSAPLRIARIFLGVIGIITLITIVVVLGTGSYLSEHDPESLDVSHSAVGNSDKEGTSVGSGGWSGTPNASVSHITSMSDDEKDKLIFGKVMPKNIKSSHVSKSEMDSKMTTIKVKVWDENGKTNEARFTLHREISEQFKHIMNDIYNHPSKPPLKTAGAYNYRTKNNGTRTSNLSNHSFGTAVDFNVPQNPFRKSHRPNKSDPRSFHDGHPVVQIFRSYGWRWGGDYHDYMHFEFFKKR